MKLKMYTHIHKRTHNHFTKHYTSFDTQQPCWLQEVPVWRPEGPPAFGWSAERGAAGPQTPGVGSHALSSGAEPGGRFYHHDHPSPMVCSPHYRNTGKREKPSKPQIQDHACEPWRSKHSLNTTLCNETSDFINFLMRQLCITFSYVVRWVRGFNNTFLNQSPYAPKLTLEDSWHLTQCSSTVLHLCSIIYSRCASSSFCVLLTIRFDDGQC